MKLPPCDAVTEFPLYQPVSAGGAEELSSLTLLSVKQTIPNLEALVHLLGLGTGIPDVTTFARTGEAQDAAQRLGELFTLYRSDKANVHNYNHVYGSILAEGTGAGILEIGIGTNNTEIVSNMGAGHPPGGSLRAFRDFTQAPVYGADFDRGILFEEPLIRCFFVDQTQPSTFLALDSDIPDGLDLVIDDGLHAPNANLATLTYGLRKVRDGGWVVIEDIGLPAVPLWQVVYALLSRGLECHLLRGRVSYMFVVRKGPPC